MDFYIAENQSVLLLPLVGEIRVTANGTDELIRPEETIFISLDKSGTFIVTNGSEDNLAHYLQIRFKNPDCERGFHLKNKFGLSDPNTLVPIFKNAEAFCFMGYYEGRNSGNYILENKKNGLFAYVIQGAFEFQDRLLESGDGLRLQGFSAIEFEALSENAMFLLIELSL